MAKEYVPDYEDYQDLIEERKKIHTYYQTAKNFKDRVETFAADCMLAEEYLRKSSYSVGRNSNSWGGEDAEAYANQARTICSDYRGAMELYIQGLQDIMDYCDDEAERLRLLINETREEMDIISKGKRLWDEMF